jgi:hypothetical protein
MTPTGKSLVLIGSTLLTLFFALWQTADAQSPDWAWAKSMGNENDNFCYSIVLDPSGNGNVYSTGWFTGTVDFDPGPGTFNLTSSGAADVFITKLNGSGNLIWARSIGGDLFNQGWSMTVDPAGSGDIYITGSFQGTVDFDPGPATFNLTSSGNTDIFITKLDGAGNFVWVKAMGGTGFDVGRSVVVDPSGSGDVYITGSFSGSVDFDPGAGTHNLNSNGDVDIFLTKLDDAGNFVWAKAMGGTGFDHGYSLAVDPSGSGNVYMTGVFSRTVNFEQNSSTFILTSRGYCDTFISKLNSAGGVVWVKAIGGAGSDSYGQSILLDPSGSGDIYTTGYFDGTVDFDPGPGTYNLSGGGNFITKLDALGKLTWARAVNGSVYAGTDRSLSIDPRGNGDIYVTGTFYGTVDFDPGEGTYNATSVGLPDIFVYKLNGEGDFEWAVPVGAAGEEFGTALAVDNSGNVFVAGYFDSPSISFGNTTLTNPENYYIGEDGNKYFYYSSDIFLAKLYEAPLSIDLVSFNASKSTEPKGVNLDWKTVSETNNDYFTIERSTDLENFKQILKVDGAGNSTNVLRYKAFDPHPVSGKNYYRLRQTDFDGKTTCSQIVTVNFETGSVEILVYPNPAVNELNFDIQKDEISNLQIRIFNSAGDIVLSSNDENISQKKTIDVSALSSGIYLIEMNIDGEKFVRKVVKE